MTLPAAAPISMSQIAAEYGVALPCVFPTAFYGKPNIAASGALSMSQFLGQSNISFTPDGGGVSESGILNAQAALLCNVPALWTWNLISGVGSVDLISGQSAASITFSCSATPIGGGQFSYNQANFTASGTAGGITRNFTVSITAEGNA